MVAEKINLSRFLVGAAATAAAMIPLVNFVLMPVAVAGATALWLERIKPGQ